MTLEPSSREHRQELEDLARHKVCHQCQGPVNVAYIERQYTLRCRCYPTAPILERPESPIERYYRTGEGDAVTIMQAERAISKRIQRAKERTVGMEARDMVAYAEVEELSKPKKRSHRKKEEETK